jgi:hypothetical protein
LSICDHGVPALAVGLREARADPLRGAGDDRDPGLARCLDVEYVRIRRALLVSGIDPVLCGTPVETGASPVAVSPSSGRARAERRDLDFCSLDKEGMPTRRVLFVEERP